MQVTQNPQVQFRRINGRIVPIKIKEGTPNQKPAISAERKARQLTKKINREGLFGNKYLNPQAIGISVLAGLGVVAGLKSTVFSIKKASSRLYGPKGFNGVERNLANLTIIRQKVSKISTEIAKEAKKTYTELDNFKKNQRTIFSYATEDDLVRRAQFLSRQALFKQEQAAKLTQNITRIKNQTGYRYTKPVVDWWKNHEFKVYTGVGAAAAFTAYGEQTIGKKKKP